MQYRVLALVVFCVGLGAALVHSQESVDKQHEAFPLTLTSKDGDIDELMFRACNKIPDDRAALNIFLWAYKTRIKFDKDFGNDL